MLTSPIALCLLTTINLLVLCYGTLLKAPDWQGLVESGALDPELARLLEESRAKWAAAGRVPQLAVSTARSSGGGGSKACVIL